MNIAGVPHQNPLSYTGPKMNLVPIKMFRREPTLTDVKYRIGSIVIIGSNPTTGTQGDLFYLSRFNSSGEAIWHKIDQSANDNNHLPWTVVTSSPHSVVVNNAYFANGAGQIEFTLPLTAEVGDTFTLCSMSLGKFVLNQNDGQYIFIGNTSTTIGTGGSITSNNLGDAITLTCAMADTLFIATTAPQGTFTVV